jgi:hypothetical protein
MSHTAVDEQASPDPKVGPDDPDLAVDAAGPAPTRAPLRRLRKRRLAVVIAGLLGLVMLVGGGVLALAGRETGPQLPRGGRSVFPEYRLVGFSGAPGSEAFGRLGIGAIDDRTAEIEKIGPVYAQGRAVMPVLDLIATIAHATPQADGMYRTRQPDAVVDEYLAAARRAKGMLIIDIQPGRADFLPEVQYFERWLKEPDVGVALDPEWAVGPTEVPGKVFGSTTGEEIDGVARYLSDLVRRYDLPEKVMVVHQLHADIIRDEQAWGDHEGVASVKSVDGIGSPGLKRQSWTRVVRDQPAHVHAGFKLFYLEDKARGGRLMRPDEVMALEPQPEYVVYE